MSTRSAGICFALLFPLLSLAQGGDQQLRAKADALFQERRFAEAMGMYSQLVSLTPGDRELNYRFGTCLLHGGEDKEKAIGHLKYATEDPAGPAAAWYWLGRAYHLNYRFKEAQTAYQRFRGTSDKKALSEWPVEGLEQQCRNGEKLLSSLKDIRVRSKVEVTDTEFFRFYELGDIGGRIVVTPDELLTSLDKKSKQRGLVYLPDRGGPIYFSSLGKDGRTGRDIYRTELLPDGSFATPLKLAGYINTDLDEDFAFMHPDGKTFYFSSKGHNSMGGYDVFRASYDKGIDAFGRPENLDFAVSTPDDDIFYMVDGEHKEACFASGRSSKQGMLHVYRVSTAQVPVVITILKGTYASQFDKEDRKAHIIVEDALTREQVADVRTDINGNYVLSLPRSGRFRFLVECGPSGKTHAGMVEVPRADGPRAYRQELDLTAQGDQEKLVIRNYFDAPLEGDIIELALEEIKRRARLDVSTGDDPVAQAPVQEPVTDVLTAAGFTGDVDKAAAVRMAEEDAAELDRAALDLDLRSKEALTLAVDALEEVTYHTQAAEGHIAKANSETIEELRNPHMVEAARSRQRAREAGMRARAAQRTADDLASESLTTRQKAAEASRISTNVRATIGAGKDQEALPHLIALKQQHDALSGPNAAPDAAERTRRAVTEQQQVAERAMRVAISKREEENELTDRVNRLKRDRDATSGRAKKEELQRGIDEGEAQLSALRDETRAAQAKANTMELETAVMRGQATLTKHLTSTAPAGLGNVPEEVASTLPQRIRDAESKANALPIDERFEALLNEPVAAMEARTFNWDLVSAARGVPVAARVTQAATREPAFDAERAALRATTVGGEAPAGGQVVGVAVADVPTSSDGDPSMTMVSAQPSTTTPTTPSAVAPANGAGADDGTRSASNTTGTGSDDTRQATNATPTDDQALAGTARPDERQATAAVDVQSRQADGQGGIEPSSNNGRSTGAPLGSPDGAVVDASRTNSTDRPDDERGATGSDGGTVKSNPSTGVELTEANGTNGERAANGTGSMSGTLADGDTPGTGEGATRTGSGAEVAMTDEIGTERFLLENERAELQQSLPAARDRADRERIQQRLVAIEGEMTRLDQEQSIAEETISEAEELAEVTVDRDRSPLVFTERTAEAVLLDSLFADHTAMRERLYRLPDADERAAGLNGLELMIADSIKEEMALQLSVLELDPQQASVILPRVERLRQMRESHRAQAERHLAERREELEALVGQVGTPAAPSEQSLASRTVVPASEGMDPIRDRFVAVDATAVYASKLDHRATSVTEAVALKEADLSRMEGLTERIDSIADRMKGMARDKEYERLEKQMDRLVDERYILSTEVGQRTAYLTREEWEVGMDSLKQQVKELAAKGLAPNDPLLVMAQGMKADAERQFKSATETRKRADRSEDILVRDNLYKEAYQMELEALRELDRSMTVHAYLVGTEHVPGEQLAYEQVAAKVLGLEEVLLAQRSTTPDLTSAVSPTSAEVAVQATVPADGAATQDALSTTVADGGAQNTELGSTLTQVAPDAEREQGAINTSAADSDVASEPTQAATGSSEGTQPSTTVARTTTTDAASEVATVPAASNSGVVDTDALLRAAESRLRPEDRIPPGMYEQYLSNEPTSLSTTDGQRDEATLLAERLQAAKREQEALQRLAVERDERATALLASAVDAKRKERERLEAMAVVERSASDSLLRESELRNAEISGLEVDQQAAARLADIKQRILKFYYLTPEDEVIVFNNSDESRYFQARAKALEQAEAAGDADAAARSNREVAQLVRTSAVEARNAAGAQPDEATLDQITRLELRAGELIARADSLEQISRKLRSASDVNMQQATVMLQRMDPVRSTELQAFEMRTRRTDALLATVRGEAGTNARIPEAAQPVPVTPANAPATSTADTAVRPSDPSTAERTADVAVVPASTGDGPPRPVVLEATAAPEGTTAPEEPSAVARTEAPDASPTRMTMRLPETLVSDIFELRPEGARADRVVLMDQPMPDGIVFKVQIGAFRKPVPEEAFSDMTPVMGETVNPGLVRYTAGLFTGFQQAAQAKDKVRGRGYDDAFVVAYRNGQRIPLGEAMRQANAASTAAARTSSAQAAAPSGTTAQVPSTVAPASTPTVAAIPAPRQEPSAPVVITATPSPEPSTDPAVILANYPATAEEVLATFTATPEATAYYNVPGAAPARQVETIKGLFFTVQVGVYSRPVPLDKLFNITPLNSERTETEKVRYTTGIYTDMAPARTRREEAITLGVKDAFITAYLNGKRIPMREANALIAKFGEAIMARP